MPTPVNIQSELDRHRETNATRVQGLVDQQYNTEITRAFELDFTSANESDATGLGRLLFAKGMRLLAGGPEAGPTGTWNLRVGVKRSLRELTSEDFICDLITLASGVHSCFQTWEFLTDDSAEASQPHPCPPSHHA
jgi:hypothetical protein